MSEVNTIRMTARRLLSVIWVTVLAGAAVFSQAGQKIAKIEVEGIQTLTAETVIATAGLKIGDAFSVDATDEAAQRLVNSGLFKKVRYRTKNTGADVTITFQVEEIKGQSSPVVFDNFIWFTDEELAAAIKREVPSFNGSAPDTGNTNESIKSALQKLLDERKLPGQVEYNLTEHEHLFRVEGIQIRICTLHFPGAQVVSEQKLIQETRNQMDREYSRQTAMIFPKYGLYPMYRELGHLRASFGDPVAKPESKEDCEGVDLTIPVNEGAKYSWAKAEWSGNQVLATKELDDALAMKAGEVASGKKFDKGVSEVRAAYGKHGYMQTRITPTPEFDDATQNVTFKIAVNEGPQYHMGAVDFRGFSKDDAFILGKRWGLRSGEVYDQSYADQFLREFATEIMTRIGRERQALGKPLPNLGVLEIPDHQTLTVNLTIELKG